MNLGRGYCQQRPQQRQGKYNKRRARDPVCHFFASAEPPTEQDPHRAGGGCGHQEHNPEQAQVIWPRVYRHGCQTIYEGFRVEGSRYQNRKAIPVFGCVDPVDAYQTHAKYCEPYGCTQLEYLNASDGRRSANQQAAAIPYPQACATKSAIAFCRLAAPAIRRALVGPGATKSRNASRKNSLLKTACPVEANPSPANSV
ncbi:hypothetical protein [Mesorhizobium sp. M4B.F.Ca.ET.089.01.1.1]|uniref:hypothetical protein n=1 Tax=Mesorhizobium sp. M4B.F.Ca.ET.089.01.1.1 TaxID=2496662 RepID=UPI0016736510|nr:hypothetical protein [Mesorhizobium sp. M4B.F.Ca.ET.089.01.1.1]